MAEHKERGAYELTEEELASSEMVFIACTLLESRGYPGFMELLNVLDNPSLILKLIRLFYGMTIKFPSLQEFQDCLRASEYIFTDLHKKVNDTLVVKPLDIRNHMGIDEQEEEKLLKLFDEWVVYMNKAGYPIEKLMHINRKMTKKRMELAINGKKSKKTRKIS
jgi:hypothetical protein